MSHAGYDIRVAEAHRIFPGEFTLASSAERFALPDSVLGIVHDKSTWARKGLSVFNTVLEPGWCGYLTLELANHGKEPINLYTGMGIAQVVFHFLDQRTDNPYSGKYQDQKAGPQEAIFETSLAGLPASFFRSTRKGNDHGNDIRQIHKTSALSV